MRISGRGGTIQAWRQAYLTFTESDAKDEEEEEEEVESLIKDLNEDHAAGWKSKDQLICHPEHAEEE